MVPTRGIVEGVQVWACQWSLGSACRVIAFVQLLNSFMKVVFPSIWRKHQVNTAWSNTFVKSCRNEQHLVKKYSRMWVTDRLRDEWMKWNWWDKCKRRNERSHSQISTCSDVTAADGWWCVNYNDGGNIKATPRDQFPSDRQRRHFRDQSTATRQPCRPIHRRLRWVISARSYT